MDSRAAFPETTNYCKRLAQQDQGTTRVSGTSELRSLAIFADECGETYNLFPLEKPVNLGAKRGGDCLPQRVSGFPASVYDPAEIGLVNANHLGKPVLPYPCFVDRQLQVRVNRPLIGFHFLLASWVTLQQKDAAAMLPKVQPLKKTCHDEMVPM